MKNPFILSLLPLFIFNTFSAFGNDGAYFSNGGILYPAQETRISIKKEILNFYCSSTDAKVSVYFEFFNPTDKVITLDVGFAAPIAIGDVSHEDIVNNIRDFRVQHEGILLPYSRMYSACDTCGLVLFDSFGEFKQWQGGNEIYLFNISFKPGVNIVQHSYLSTAGGSVSAIVEFDYVLTTGSQWAGGIIEDFTLQISTTEFASYLMSDVFPEKANWKLIGNGKFVNNISGHRNFFFEHSSYASVNILSGSLHIHADQFSPSHNLKIVVLSLDNPLGFERWNFLGDDYPANIMLLTNELDSNYSYSKEECYILRNAIYAYYGYYFQSEDLRKYFAQFAWYIPDKSIKMMDIHLSDEHRNLLKQILDLEANF